MEPVNQQKEDIKYFDDLIRTVPLDIYLPSITDEKHHKRLQREEKSLRQKERKINKKRKLDPTFNSEAFENTMSKRIQQLAEEQDARLQRDADEFDHLSPAKTKQEHRKAAKKKTPLDKAATHSEINLNSAADLGDLNGTVEKRLDEDAKAKLKQKLDEMRKKRNADDSKAKRRRENSEAKKEQKVQGKHQATKKKEFSSEEKKKPKVQPVQAEIPSIEYNTFDFSSGVPTPAYLAKGKTSDEVILKRAQKHKEKLDQLRKRGTEEDVENLKRIALSKALAKAEGHQVKDNPQKIKKSIKQKESKKLKSAQEWKQREDAQKQQQELRQKKREENIQRYRGKKGKKGGSGFEGKKGKKKGGSGFEGKKGKNKGKKNSH